MAASFRRKGKDRASSVRLRQVRPADVCSTMLAEKYCGCAGLTSAVQIVQVSWTAMIFGRRYHAKTARYLIYTSVYLYNTEESQVC